MAANDYYNTSYGQSHSRTDAPLPAVPGHPQQRPVSPVSSPFEDNTYHSSGAQGGYPDTSYSNFNSTSNLNTNHGRYDSPGRHSDPFADQNAIPLQSQPKMDHGSPTQYHADPEQFGAGVEKRKKKKKGWFSGRVTWVVYILTTVQIGVFVGELIKNGMSLGFSWL